jgi:hypothetical protein
VKKLICVDLHIRNKYNLERLTPESLKLTLIEGDSHRGETLERVRTALKGDSVDLLFVDGDHSFWGAFMDFVDYSSLLRQGGLAAFHDIVPDRRLRLGRFSCGPAYAGEVPLVWSRLKRRYQATWEFVEDWSQEGFGIGVIENDGLPILEPLEMLI